VSAEVNLDYAREAGIQIVRRSSGGGAIFTDLGTVLYTIVLPYDGKEPVQQIAKVTVAGMIIEALGRMRVSAVQEGRNDILIDGRKISGLAQYLHGGHLCTHGSLLYDTDLEMLVNVLKPNEEKLKPKGIRSIRSRVTNIKPFMDTGCSVEEFINRLRQALLCGKDHSIHKPGENELEHINRIYHERYGNHTWNIGE
jgi:lipoate-protein ligase A